LYGIVLLVLHLSLLRRRGEGGEDEEETCKEGKRLRVGEDIGWRSRRGGRGEEERSTRREEALCLVDRPASIPTLSCPS